MWNEIALQSAGSLPLAIGTFAWEQAQDSATANSDRYAEVEEVHDEKDWAAWDDAHGDDWADQVGQEDWTGRRIDARKAAVHNVWTADEPLRSVRQDTV